MEKPAFKPWAHAVTLWYEYTPGVEEAKRQALMQIEMDAMQRLVDMAEPIAIEIGQLSVEIAAMESRRESLSKLYKGLEKQFDEHSATFDKHSVVNP